MTHIIRVCELTPEDWKSLRELFDWRHHFLCQGGVLSNQSITSRRAIGKESFLCGTMYSTCIIYLTYSQAQQNSNVVLLSTTQCFRLSDFLPMPVSVFRFLVSLLARAGEGTDGVDTVHVRVTRITLLTLIHIFK